MKRWSMKLDHVFNHLPLPTAQPRSKVILYSLHEKKNDRWIRISDCAYPPRTAAIVFADRLAIAPLSRTIRPVKLVLNEAK